MGCINSEVYSRILLKLALMGQNRCQITRYSGLSDGTHTDLFLQITFQYCCYTWSLKPIREVFHFVISFICWFRVTRSSSVLSGVLIAAEVNGIGDQKPADTTTLDVQTFLEASEHILEIYLSKIFSGKKD